MVKKVILGMALVGLVAVLVVGAVIRTMDKTDQSAEGPRGQGRGRSAENALVTDSGREGNGNQGGQGSNQRQSDAAGEPAAEAAVVEWVTHTGVIVAVDEETLSVMLNEGDILVIEGRPLSFAQEQGSAYVVGDNLVLAGFYEDDEFEVGRIENLTTGETVLLRDETGRPMWAGRGQRGA